MADARSGADGPEVYAGLMSGTSLDGVDAVLVRFQPEGGAFQQVLGHVHRPFDAALRDELLALNTPGPDELHRASVATVRLAAVYADALTALLADAGPACPRPVAVGAHGQTVRHRPDGLDGSPGYTVQLDPGPWLAERSGLLVVSDFRSQDVAAGGQGAPLVPPYHRAVFGRAGEPVVVVNVGGMANVSVIDGRGGVLGFDSGPGNALMDLWSVRTSGAPFDADGALAAAGRLDAALLAAFAADPFFALPPPRSTGRDLFSPAWLDTRLGTVVRPAADVQATLAELTATTVADAVVRGLSAAGVETADRARTPRPGQPVLTVWVCGGGARNAHLMRRLQAALPGARVRPSDDAGLPAMQVEACAFAWLARERLAGRATSEAGVTGARGARCGGAVRRGGVPG